MTDLRMATWFRMIVAALLVLVASVACAQPEQPLAVVDEEVSGQGTLGLSVEGQPPSGIVVYFHGMDQDAEVTRSDGKHEQLTQALLRKGYAVVSADAAGNAFGNIPSQEAYRTLITAAKTRYGTDEVVFLAESMGGLPALMLMADPGTKVRKMAAVTPVMGMPAGARSIDFVAAAWNGEVPEAVDPMGWPVDRLSGKLFRLYAADGDGVIPPGATADDFEARYGGVAGVEVARCHGNHVADTCFDAAGIAGFFGG